MAQTKISGTPARIEAARWPWKPGLTTATIRSAALDLVSKATNGDGAHVLTLNLDIYAQITRPSWPHQRLRESFDYLLADGMPILWASRLAGRPVPERVTGADLLPSVVELAVADGVHVHLSGGGEGVAAHVVDLFKMKYGRDIALSASAIPLPARWSAGPYDEAAKQIAATEARVIFLAYGFPKQDLLAQAVHRIASDRVVIGCGAALDFAAGRIRRAPVHMQRSGLEWLHRLVVEPERLAARYLARDLPALPRLLVSAIQHRRLSLVRR